MVLVEYMCHWKVWRAISFMDQRMCVVYVSTLYLAAVSATIS